MSLAERLYALPGFRAQLRGLSTELLSKQFAFTPAAPIARNFDVGYLLTCATVLAQSNTGDCIQAALQIARYALTSESLDVRYKDAAAVVYDMLANQPAIKLSLEKDLLQAGLSDRLPLPLRIDVLQRRVESATMSADHRVVYFFNRFQQEVREAFRENSWVSISAPTSAGKSFAVQRLLEIALVDGEVSNAVCIVPTRALIQQTETDLAEAFKRAALVDVELQTMPQLRDGWESRRTVYVFTQERMHWLLRDAPEAFNLDLIIIDEAHKLGDGARGVLLDQVLVQVLDRLPECRVLFSSPLAENPGVLLELAPPNVKSVALRTDYAAVTQNLIWASPLARKPIEWRIEQIVDSAPVEVGQFKLRHRPNPESKRLPLVADALGGWASGNLVYANGAADAEKMATMIASSCPDPQAFEADAELQELANLASRLVHKQYRLVDTVRHGVGFHYGNMPTLLRTEIERLFREGRLKYLVCTSTLLEGVNLAARCIFLRGPDKGRGKGMQEMDFWNLAGRAGRLGKDFEGNIICVDPRNEAVWDTPPPTKRVHYKLRSTVEQLLSERTDELLTYIGEQAPLDKALREPALEYALVYLTAIKLRHGTLVDSPLARRIPVELLSLVGTSLGSALDSIIVPHELLTRHPGVSAFAQQRLLTFFNHASAEDIEKLIPVPPEVDDAIKAYRPIVLAINKHFTGEPDGLWFPRAQLVVRWMQGWALARIISANESYWTKKAKRPKKLPEIIRGTMADVEDYARFRFLKFASCYVEILRWHLRNQRRNEALADTVPDLSLWLEFGASTNTQLILMALGLSRTAAAALSELNLNDAMTEEQVVVWLRSLGIDGLDLPAAVRREIFELQRRLHDKAKVG